MSLNVLVVGSGAREHVIAEKIAQSPFCKKLFLTHKFPYFDYEMISYTDFYDLAEKSKQKEIDLVIVGAEQPLAEGIVDILNPIKCIGVNKYWANLEASKLFAKKFMKKYGINTGDFEIFNSKSPEKFPIVLKADGLCQGKGVEICFEKADFHASLNRLKKFGKSSETILLEEYLEGDEISVFSYFNSEKLINFQPARDFKRLSMDKKSSNTGGMGAFCPVNLTDEQKNKLDKYLAELEKALLAEKADFRGFIYSGLIWAKNNWFVLEYNVRLGDPECQAVLNCLKTDFLSILIGKADKVEFNEERFAVLTLATNGYPQNPILGNKIILPENNDIKVYFAGAKLDENNNLISIGGRVLSLVTKGDEAFQKLVNYAKNIEMDNKYFRKDLKFN